MTWSLSRLKTYESCHAKYNYRYNLKIADGGISSPQAARGVKVHKEIEDAINGNAPFPMEASHVPGHLGELGVLGVDHQPEFTIKLDRQWKQVVTGDYWYHGIIDLYVRNGPVTATIYDWKTGKQYPDHEDQKELYALALFAVFPELEEVSTIFHYLDLKKQVQKVFHPHMAMPARERWEKRVVKMEQATEFIPMPGWLCRYCPYSKTEKGPCRF